QYIVDFAGPALAALPPDAAVEAVVTSPANGEIVESNAYYVEPAVVWRVMLRVKQIDLTQPTELRACLQHGSDVLTETWSYLVPPRRAAAARTIRRRLHPSTRWPAVSACTLPPRSAASSGGCETARRCARSLPS